MKQFFVIGFLLLGSLVFSQETGNDSYTIQRLIIYNPKGEILLLQHPNGWMTPALRHNTETTTNQGLRELASEYGLKISVPQLQGIFMYLHSDHKKPSFRQHYSAKWLGGEFIIPENEPIARWFPPQEAIEKMLLPESKIVDAVGHMTEHILNYPNTIWGGSYMLIKKEGEKTQSRMIESFYPIGRVE